MSLQEEEEPTVVIGIDPASTRVAAISALVLDGGDLSLVDHSFRTLGERYSPAAASAAMGWAWDLIGHARGFGLPQVWIEAPAVGRSAMASVKQAFVSGALQAAFALEGVPVHLVNVMTWKATLGNGRASKAEVQRMVGERWPEAAAAAGSTEDLFDAAGVTLHGVESAARTSKLVEESKGMRA